MPDRLIERWRGVVLVIIGVVATVWLAVTGQLGLYIHPRYFVFTVVMAIIAAVLAIAAFAFVPSGGEAGHAEAEHADAEHEDAEHEHEHEHTHDERAPARGIRRLTALVGVVTIIAAAVGLLLLPPHTLTAATAAQRSVNDASSNVLQADAPALVGGDPSQFTIKDWAVLMRQSQDPSYFQGVHTTLVGFVLPSEDDPDNVFYISRFVITCCAVDAQPVGVPVYRPGWSSSLDTDDWVEASGGFATAPAGAASGQIVFTPDKVSKTEKPSQPYVY